MEKFSQFRDRGTQIAPFLPISGTATLFQSVYQPLLFAIRLPFFLPITIVYLFLLTLLIPLPSLIRKAWLWSILGVAGVWWVDLQVTGIKRGTLAAASQRRLPQPGSIMISTCTSPLDAIYLAAVFDPVFTISYPNSPLLRRVSLPIFLLSYFTEPALAPSPSDAGSLTTLSQLLKHKPGRCICLFPEATATNGRGVLRFGPALATAPEDTRIFPVSLKYSPADVTTPLPSAASAWSFVYSLLSRPTHCIRVRIAEAVYNKSCNGNCKMDGNEFSIEELGAEALARIGRVKRLNLGVAEKVRFLEAWRRNRR